MRMAAAMQLIEEESRGLRRLSSSRSIAVGLHRRARIVLLASEGKCQQGDRRRGAWVVPAHGRPVARSVRRQADGGHPPGASAWRQSRRQGFQGAGEASRPDHRGEDPNRACGCDALVVPQYGQRDGRDSQPGLGVQRAEAASDPDVQAEPGPAVRTQAGRCGSPVPRSARKRDGIRLRQEKLDPGAGPDPAGCRFMPLRQRLLLSGPVRISAGSRPAPRSAARRRPRVRRGRTAMPPARCRGPSPARRSSANGPSPAGPGCRPAW